MTYRWIYILAAIFALSLVIVALSTTSANSATRAEPLRQVSAVTYQGKDVTWWAKRAVQARKDANARKATIKRLKHTIRYSVSISECVKLATIAYPDLDLSRAWRIIGGESKGNPNARNRKAIWNGEHAAGLWQFIPSTFYSTPYGKAGMSLWSPCASSLAAGWMHEHGRGREWTGY